MLWALHPASANRASARVPSAIVLGLLRFFTEHTPWEISSTGVCAAASAPEIGPWGIALWSNRNATLFARKVYVAGAHAVACSLLHEQETPDATARSFKDRKAMTRNRPALI